MVKKHKVDESEVEKLRPENVGLSVSRKRRPKRLVQTTLTDQLQIGPAVMDRPRGWNLTMTDHEAEALKQQYKRQFQVSSLEYEHRL